MNMNHQKFKVYSKTSDTEAPNFNFSFENSHRVSLRICESVWEKSSKTLLKPMPKP